MTENVTINKRFVMTMTKYTIRYMFNVHVLPPRYLVAGNMLYELVP